jgi:ParB-like chromosome segregation protein Spo0J
MNPADKIERRSIEKLIPYARNSRTHSDAQVAQIAASIKEWGWTMPILVDEAGGIIAGHGRVLAARSLGHEDVPVVVAKGWSESKKRAYVIADNKLALNAGWDFEMLASEIEELNSDGYELDLIGFNAEEMDKVINPVVDTPPEDFNEYGDDIETEYKCPKCSYEWSGKAK